MTNHAVDEETQGALGATFVSPMAGILKEDADGAFRDEIVALFEELSAQVSHAMRKPLSASEFEFNETLFAAISVAKQVVGDYWARHHRR